MEYLLHVEDDDAAAVAFRAALDEAHIHVNVDRVSNGKQALQYLQRQGTYAGTGRPGAVLLDLNMPEIDGWQILEAFAADERLRAIPVIVLTTSSRLSDEQRALGLGARRYLVKPRTFSALVEMVGSLGGEFLPRPT